MMVRTMLALMKDPSLDPKASETAASMGKSAIVIDAKGLYDALRKEGIGSSADKRAGIEILCCKEEIARQRTELRWVSSERIPQLRHLALGVRLPRRFRWLLRLRV